MGPTKSAQFSPAVWVGNRLSLVDLNSGATTPITAEHKKIIRYLMFAAAPTAAAPPPFPPPYFYIF